MLFAHLMSMLITNIYKELMLRRAIGSSYAFDHFKDWTRFLFPSSRRREFVEVPLSWKTTDDSCSFERPIFIVFLFLLPFSVYFASSREFRVFSYEYTCG